MKKQTTTQHSTPRTEDGRAFHQRRVPADTVDRQATASELLRRCAQGDHDALADLHRLLSKPLLATARRMLRSSEEAEEVVQEVFLYVWQHAAAYDPKRAAVSTWLGRITRSRAIDRIRKAKVADRTRSQLARERSSTVEPQAERTIAINQWRHRLQREIRALPRPQRQALLLAYYGELTQSEIAARVQIPLGTVKTRTHLALRKLRAASGLRHAAAGGGLATARMA